MQQASSRRRTSHWLIVGVAVAALLGGTLFLLRRAPSAETSARQRPANKIVERQHGYRNRAVWQSPSAADTDERPTITGYVYGADGAAIAGATVTAATFQVAGNVLTPAGSARSGDDGRFELKLPDGTYQLSARMIGYGTTSASAHSGEMVSLVLPKSGIIEGRVLDERGQPVQRFVIDVVSAVTADAPAMPALFSRTFEGADGSFRIDQLPSWDVVVRATAEGYAPAFSESVVVGSSDTLKMDLALSKGCTMTGVVVDQRGDPVSGVFLDAESVLVAGEMTDLTAGAETQTVTEMDGSFQLANVPKGAVMVRGYDGENAVSTLEVEVPSCDAVKPVRLVMSPGGSIMGIARDAGGKPLAGARLTLMHRPIGFVNTTSDAEGRFQFEQVPAGAIRMMVRHGDQVAVTGVSVKDGETTQQDVVLAAPGTGALRGRVTAGGKPLASVQLMVATTYGTDGAIALYHPTTEQDGSYHLSSLPAGPYLISVVSTSTGQSIQLAPDKVTTVDLQVTSAPSMKERSAAQADVQKRRRR